MRCLVLGAGGMAGHVISLYLQEVGYEVIGVARRPLDFVQTVIADVRDFRVLQSVLFNGGRCFDVVINAVGVLNKAASDEKGNAILVNSYLPHFLASSLQDTQSKLIHLSTDCVFSGNDGPYEEGSLPDATSFYGRTKALGEIDNKKDLTIRTSIIGPDINPKGIGLFNWFMNQKSVVFGYSKAIWTGLTTIELAHSIPLLLEKRLSGVVHVVPDRAISKFDLLKLFNYYFAGDRLEIRKDESHVLNKALLRNRKVNDLENKNYEDQLLEMKEWIMSHRALYPHYNC